MNELAHVTDEEIDRIADRVLEKLARKIQENQRGAGTRLRDALDRPLDAIGVTNLRTGKISTRFFLND